jgi:tetratricopeptide (TPR) repeat protein
MPPALPVQPGTQEKIDKLLQEADRCFKAGAPDEAREHLEQLLTLFRAIGDRKNIGAALNNIGSVYRDTGRYEDAMRTYRESLDIRRQINDLDGLAATLHNLGALCLDLEDFDEARRFLTQARAVCRDVDDKGALGRTVLCLGRLHETLGHLDQAAACYEQARQLATHPDVCNEEDEAAALHNLGGVAITLDNPANGLRLLERAGDIFAASGQKAGLAMVLYNSAIAYRVLGQLQDALHCLDHARDIQEQLGDRRGLGITLATIGIVRLECSELEPAYHSLAAAERLQESLGLHAARADTHAWLGRVCERWGRADDALSHYRLAAFFTAGEAADAAAFPGMQPAVTRLH